MSIVYPKTELAWGGGRRWNRGARRSVQPAVEAVIELAHEGLSSLDITYKLPKRLIVWRAANCFDERSGALNERELELYLPISHIRHRKVSRNLARVTKDIVHELVHTAVSEREDREDIIGQAATEGLAYVAADQVARRLLFPYEHDDVSHIVEDLPPRFVAGLKRSLLVDGEIDDGNDYELYAKWFDVSDPVSGLPPGAVVGVKDVLELTRSGRSLSELVDWPAEAILGVETHVQATA